MGDSPATMILPLVVGVVCFLVTLHTLFFFTHRKKQSWFLNKDYELIREELKYNPDFYRFMVHEDTTAFRWAIGQSDQTLVRLFLDACCPVHVYDLLAAKEPQILEALLKDPFVIVTRDLVSHTLNRGDVSMLRVLKKHRSFKPEYLMPLLKRIDGEASVRARRHRSSETSEA